MNISEFSIIRTRIDTFPTIFVPRKIARKIGALAIARCNKNAILLAVAPMDLIANRAGSRIALNKSAYIALKGPKEISLEIADPRMTIFVYSKGLSSYWNPFTCELHRGASGELPHIKGILKGFSLTWQKESELPSITKDNDIILGEVYPNALGYFADYFDRSDGWTEKTVKITPAENMIKAEPISAKIYFRKDKKGYGLKATSIKYPDSYCICNYLFSYSEFSSDLYIKWIIGNSPVIITAPHGGLLRPTNVPAHQGLLGDSFTLDIAEGIIRRTFELSNWHILPSGVLSRAYRNFVELNRPYEPQDDDAKRVYRKYHELITNLIKVLRKLHDWVLILDIHGMRNLGLDVVLGTDYGRSISGFEDKCVELKRTLEKEFTVGVNDFGLAGKHTVTRYSSLSQVRVIQIEASLDTRLDPEKRAKLIDLVAEYVVKVSGDKICNRILYCNGNVSHANC
ncbi:MAG: N-formylglutamate amidohydrolase [Candidatus Korarchaeota archaeon]|nr:N-formylglutamate amidohydrolase [Thermoproteota archaeon]MCR8462923.1 N-formylglutamate amidohydrolase [Thermoproteota archaeon]MCR8470395.1 N-formylglutamate amidohydrolase [Thermoproteota archaeon]MCR8472148.1 N-formylglutamate amidohydrolase [Thermoproteota archaeon]MCR8472929.1 N-formylglutamate amidohydrolase [Thermoproteota archaeon]